MSERCKQCDRIECRLVQTQENLNRLGVRTPDNDAEIERIAEEVSKQFVACAENRVNWRDRCLATKSALTEAEKRVAAAERLLRGVVKGLKCNMRPVVMITAIEEYLASLPVQKEVDE